MPRIFALTRLSFGWDWFIGPADHHDGRRRSTKTLAMFFSPARQTALGNAVIRSRHRRRFRASQCPWLGYALPEASASHKPRPVRCR